MRFSTLLLASCLALVLGTGAARAQGAVSCPPGDRCGSVTVPLDRANPAAGTIDIGYDLLPHTDTSRPALGTIVPNPGGPGNSTTAFTLYRAAFAPLRARRDVLLVDARGTGRSGALSCPTLSTQDPLRVTKEQIGALCGRDLGPRAGFFGSAAIADDIDAVRAALGIDKLDLWGDSYGTFLMPVYAARHPERVRSIVLDGAFPVASDVWGRDVLRGVRRVVGLVCARSGRCSGRRVLADVARLARRLRTHPRTFTAYSPLGRVRVRMDENALADVTYGGGNPELTALLPAAVRAALHGDRALLERAIFAGRVGIVGALVGDPTVFSIGAAAATSCHDYPRPYDLAAPPEARHAQYAAALAALDRAQFRPFSPEAWLSTTIDAGPSCLDWPADPTAGSPLRGLSLPDVPVLVQSGDLDGNTPVEQGRVAAAQFPHATFAVVANVGHTPDTGACGRAMALDFIRRLRVDAHRCRHAGHAPAVPGRPAQRAAQLAHLRLRAPAGVRRAVGVALATIADARMAARLTQLTGTLGALRGGSYSVSGRGVDFTGAKVVRDAVVDGSQHGHRARLRVHGPGVPRARLTIRGRHVTGTVAGHRIALRVP